MTAMASSSWNLSGWSSRSVTSVDRGSSFSRSTACSARSWGSAPATLARKVVMCRFQKSTAAGSLPLSGFALDGTEPAAAAETSPASNRNSRAAVNLRCALRVSDIPLSAQQRCNVQPKLNGACSLRQSAERRQVGYGFWLLAFGFWLCRWLFALFWFALIFRVSSRAQPRDLQFVPATNLALMHNSPTRKRSQRKSPTPPRKAEWGTCKGQQISSSC